MSYSLLSNSDFFSKSVEMIENYRNNPVLAAEDLLSVDLDTPQKVVFEDMWFKPYVLVSAGRGSGKCVAGDTLIPTDKGLVYIDSLGNKLDPLSELETKVYGKEGLDTTSHWYYNGFAKVNKITTNFGYHISATDDHRVLVLEEDSKIGWKYSSDVVVGDIVCIERNSNIWPKEDKCTEDEAALLGLMVDPDCTGEKETYIPAIVMQSGKQVMASFLRALYGCGCYSKIPSGFCSTASKRLAQEVHVALLNFGVVSKLEEKYEKDSDATYFIKIAQNSIELFEREIISSYLYEDSLCNLADKNYFFDKVVTVDTEWADTYDLVVPEGKSFTGNGFVNHNTFLLSVLTTLYAMLYPGKRVLIMSSSFRQCVVGSTLVVTDKGIERVGTLEDAPSKMLSSAGMKDCEGFYKNLPEPTIGVETSRGFYLEGAEDHRVLCMSDSGKPVYKVLRECSEEDYLVLLRGTNSFGMDKSISRYIPKFVPRGNLKPVSLPDTVTPDLAYFMGLIVGDGCLTRRNYMVFFNVDQYLLDSYIDICSKYFGKPNVCYKEDGVVQVAKCCKLGYEFLESVGIAGKGAAEKSVPNVVLSGSYDTQMNFLQGLFDTDGNAYFNPDVSHKYKVSFATISKDLAQTVQVMLLNMGVLSSISKNNSGNRKSVLYSLEISDKASVIQFSKLVGFKLQRKQFILDNIVDYIYSTDVGRTHSDVVPFVGEYLSNIVKSIRSSEGNHSYLNFSEYFDSNSDVREGRKVFTLNYINKLLKHCEEYNIDTKSVRYIKFLTSGKFIFDKVVNKSSGFDCTYDFTVDEVHNYFSNGFVSHNSKNCFGEVKNRYMESPILRESTIKKPVISSDNCYLHFRSPANRYGSKVEAYPLGSGDKIRGLRGHLIVVDEFAQVPSEIFEMVIRPMGATTTSPMQKVRMMERLKRNLEKGVITQEQYNEEVGGHEANKIVCVSSAYYQFNHMYKRILAYEEEIRKGSEKYAVHTIDYRDMSEGFLDADNVAEAKATMSRIEFSLEYEAKWESDSDGLFKASLLEECKDHKCPIRIKGEVGRKYIIGIDPARSSAAFALVVIEVGNPSYVVNVFQATGKTFPVLAQIVRDYCDEFNPVLVVMDAGAGGGGVAIKDILSSEQFSRGNLILDMDDEEHKELLGRHIIRMDDPNPKNIAATNYASVNLLEQGMLRFPFPPIVSSDETENIYDNIKEMLMQMMLIIPTETRSGLAHFDIPSQGTGTKKGSRRKDLYSAFILAAKGVYDSVIAREEDASYVNQGGLVIPVNRSKAPTITSIMGLPGRV
jgi:intein/homing endonuclease